MASIFSRIVAGDIPSYKVAENDSYFAFLDINPVSKGHTLVVPKIEVDYIFDLDDDTLSGLHVFAKKVAQAIKSVVPCNRIGVTVIGLEVPHAHIHLIPINGLLDMDFTKDKVVMTKPEFESLSQQIASAFHAKTS
jgi:histidine triad (HIT) family protein